MDDEEAAAHPGEGPVRAGEPAHRAEIDEVHLRSVDHHRAGAPSLGAAQSGVERGQSGEIELAADAKGAGVVAKPLELDAEAAARRVGRGGDRAVGAAPTLVSPGRVDDQPGAAGAT